MQKHKNWLLHFKFYTPHIYLARKLYHTLSDEKILKKIFRLRPEAVDTYGELGSKREIIPYTL